jgi:hypothetical protein
MKQMSNAGRERTLGFWLGLLLRCIKPVKIISRLLSIKLIKIIFLWRRPALCCRRIKLIEEIFLVSHYCPKI